MSQPDLDHALRHAGLVIVRRTDVLDAVMSLEWLKDEVGPKPSVARLREALGHIDPWEAEQRGR